MTKPLPTRNLPNAVIRFCRTFCALMFPFPTPTLSSVTYGENRAEACGTKKMLAITSRCFFQASRFKQIVTIV